MENTDDPIEISSDSDSMLQPGNAGLDHSQQQSDAMSLDLIEDLVDEEGPEEPARKKAKGNDGAQRKEDILSKMHRPCTGVSLGITLL